jgi:hypothetical protein
MAEQRRTNSRMAGGEAQDRGRRLQRAAAARDTGQWHEPSPSPSPSAALARYERLQDETGSPANLPGRYLADGALPHRHGTAVLR